MDISIIIVNFQTYDLTKRCVESVLEALDKKNLTGEILLIDNHSEDGSGERLKEAFNSESRVEVILNDYNAGFSVANNIGLNKAHGDYLLLLNSDTIVNEDTLSKTVDYLKSHKDCGALGCKVVLPDGKLDVACKRSFPTPFSALSHFTKLDKIFPKSPIFSSYNLTYLDEDVTHDVDCIMGAYMCLTREAYQKVGGLDEDYFMYGEDTDLCYRLRDAGFNIVYYPEAQITHYKKASWSGKKNPKVLDSFYDSMLIFYDKHYKEKYNRITRSIVRIGVKSFKAVDRLRNRFLAKK